MFHPKNWESESFLDNVPHLMGLKTLADQLISIYPNMEVPKKVENKKEEKAYVRLGKLQSLLMCWQRGAALRQKGETARGEHNHNLTNIKLYHLTYVVAFYFLQRALRQKGGRRGGGTITPTSNFLVYFLEI